MALALVAAVAGCGDRDPVCRPRAPGEFDDHSQPCLPTLADFGKNARRDLSYEAVDFVIAPVEDPVQRHIRYLDSQFYSLHDEWYWFRLLNGQRVPGDNVQPVAGLSFKTIGEIYDWARAQTKLPLDLYLDGRLYSTRFYDLALGRPRIYGPGVLIHAPEANGRPEIWAFELEYPDPVTHDELLVYFQQLEATLPAEITRDLRWIARSPVQEALAQRMAAESLRYHERIIRYRDLVVPGDVQVYNPGITAGRLRVVRKDDPFPADSTADDILVFEEVPGDLPQAAGVVTATPQTPLAHISLLARSRRIPNAYRGGALADPLFVEYARVLPRLPVLMRATADNKLVFVAISEAEFATYNDLRRKTAHPPSPPPPDLSSVPPSYDLGTLDIQDLDRLRPIIGGKSAGMIALLTSPGVPTPDRPLALTIKPYVEHFAPLRPAVETLLASGDFRYDPLVRYLALEGEAAFDRQNGEAAAQDRKRRAFETHPAGTPIGDLLRGGGVKGAITAQPIAPATSTAIGEAVRAQFGRYAPGQGLRFRSSSNVEDAEGYSAAGLYDSNTGYIDAAAQSDPSDRGKTIDAAVRATWASYWGFPAFEERRANGIDHFAGAMGVTVHANFNDDKELANGVLTLTLTPAPGTGEWTRRMDLNVQIGPTSVVKPEPGSSARPEVDRLIASGDGAPTIERLQPSTLAAPGAVVFDDQELLSLFGSARKVSDRWIAEVNRTLPPALRSRTLVLDFEFRKVAPGWPAVDDAPPYPPRIVLKQARSLDPGIRRLPVELRGLALPRDVLARARRIETRTCAADAVSFGLTEATTDSALSPDLGYAHAPFTGSLVITFVRDVPEIGRKMGESIPLDHTAFSFDHPGLALGGPWTLALFVTPGAGSGVTGLVIDPEGRFRLRTDAGDLESSAACSVDVLFATPEDYLLGLLGDQGK